MTEKALQVLLVEDNAGDVRLLREMFSKERPDSFELTHLLRMSEAEIHLAKGGVDIVLLDMGLPDGHGLDTVRRAHAAAPGVPMIVLTGLDDEALAAEAMKEGAQDYLIKGQIESRALPRALRHAIERHRMQKETAEEAEKGKFIDSLAASNRELELRNREVECATQLKSKFLANMSHELRTPLNAIVGFSDLLAEETAGQLNDKQKRFVNHIKQGSAHLLQLITDILDSSKIEAGHLES